MYTYIKITFGKIDKFPDECIMNTLLIKMIVQI